MTGRVESLQPLSVRTSGSIPPPSNSHLMLSSGSSRRRRSYNGAYRWTKPEGGIGCHPSDRPYHGISFYCDDIEATVAELAQRGVEFSAPIREEEGGSVTTFELPGGGPVDLYQPKYT